MIQCIFEDGGKASLRHVTVDVLVLKNDKILLVKRANHLLEGGKWGLVGGYADRDESLIEAARREIDEETGYKVKDIKLLTINGNHDRPNEDRQNVAFVFYCTALNQESDSDDEVLEQKWFAFDQLPNEDEIAFDHSLNMKVYLEYLKTGKLPIPNI